jgi:hypothetical protein
MPNIITSNVSAQKRGTVSLTDFQVNSWEGRVPYGPMALV